MHRKFTWHFFLISALLFSCQFSAQHKFSLAVGVSQCRSQPLITDPGAHIVSWKGPSPMLNIDLSMRIQDIWHAETGIFVKGTGDGFGFRGFFTGNGGNAPHLVIPLRLVPTIPVVKDRLFCSPIFGVSLGLNPNNGSTGSGSGFVGQVNLEDTLQGIRWKEQEDHRFTGTYVLFQVGLSVQFVFKNQSALQLRSGYYLGRRTLSKTEIQYQVNGGPENRASLVSNGTFWQVLGFAFVYPLGRKQAEEEPED